VAAAFTGFSIAALTACGAGADAGTSQIKPDNAYAHVDDILVQNVNVVLPEDSPDGPATVVARLFNEGAEDQTLESITLPGSDERVELRPAEGESRVVVPAGGSVALGGEGNPEAVIEDPAAADVALGNAQRLVFTLSDTGEVELHARVVPDSGEYAYYEDWGPTPSASPEETSPAPGEPEETETGEGSDEGAAESEETEGTTEGTDDGEGAEGTTEAAAEGTTGAVTEGGTDDAATVDGAGTED
jgi:hypothetical protein